MLSHTKIVATIGPATASAEGLKSLYQSGMRIARLNGSHNNLEWHQKIISQIHKILPELPILLDIPGKKIRTMYLKNEPSFNVGDLLVLTSEKFYKGSNKIPVSYENLHLHLEVGNQILADDGTLRFIVTQLNGKDITIRAEVAGTLKSRKGINVPQVKLIPDLITLADIEMINFAQSNEVDYIGLSFVESMEQVEAYKTAVGKIGRPRIISKIENQAGYDNMLEIIKISDGIMIDRGDLSVETQLETIALMQKEIIRVSRANFKPVIVATEMLHTMTENSFPTKAEVSDICNAVLDGASGVMLSGETAIGNNPDLAVQLMNRVAFKAESYLSSIDDMKDSPDNPQENSRLIADAINLICKGGNVTKIISITRTGYSARVLSSKNLKQDIFAVSDDFNAAKSFNLYSGVEGVFWPKRFPSEGAEHVLEIVKFLYTKGKINDLDKILTVAAIYPVSGQFMNSIQVHSVSDLKLNR